jgi:dihydrofolate reductase
VRVSLICALGRNRAIGRDKGLPWHIAADLKRFKSITMGHPIIMGRKTYESIGRPLPGRTNIVVTRHTNYQAAGCEIVHALDDALALARKLEPDINGETFVIGGGELYAQALGGANRLYLTLVDDAPRDADTFFPEYADFARTLDSTPGDAGTPAYRFLTLERE